VAEELHTTHRYRLSGEGMPWSSTSNVISAILSVFCASKSSTLNLGLPDEFMPCPASDERFRNAAAQIVEQAPGIWLSVLGGQSDIAREIFLANLPNIRVAHHDGAIAVSLPALEAQTFLHDQFCALLHAGVSEADAIKEIHALSLNCGMAADAWR